MASGGGERIWWLRKVKNMVADITIERNIQSVAESNKSQTYQFAKRS